MIGSKLAARGTAVEAYYNRNLTKALSMSLRATKITYDWTGSNGFGGVGSAPTDMSTITSANAAMYGNPVKEAKDIRLAITYSY